MMLRIGPSRNARLPALPLQRVAARAVTRTRIKLNPREAHVCAYVCTYVCVRMHARLYMHLDAPNWRTRNHGNYVHEARPRQPCRFSLFLPFSLFLCRANNRRSFTSARFNYYSSARDSEFLSYPSQEHRERPRFSLDTKAECDVRYDVRRYSNHTFTLITAVSAKRRSSARILSRLTAFNVNFFFFF